MAENVTVDELSINVQANAGGATTSIDALTRSLTDLNRVLAPTLRRLQSLSSTLTRINAKAVSKAAAFTSGAATAQARVSNRTAKTKDPRLAIEDSMQRIDKLQTAFSGVSADFRDGLVPANVALKQMGSIIGRVNSELVKLKATGGEIVPDGEFVRMDAQLEEMIRDAQRLKNALRDAKMPGVRDVSKIAPVAQPIEKASLAIERLRAGLGAFQGFTGRGQFDPISPNATEQLRSAQSQLSYMRTQVQAIARENGVAFDSPVMARYVQMLTAAQNRLDRLNASVSAARAVPAQTPVNTLANLQGTFNQVSGDVASGAIPANAGLAQMKSLLSRINAEMVKMKLAGQSVPDAEFARMKAQVDAVNNSLKQTTTATKEAGAAGKGLGKSFKGSFIQIRSWVFFLLFALAIFKRAVDATVGRAMDFIETKNLFDVAMDSSIGKANAFVESMSNALGLDPANIMKYQATFKQIAESIGVTGDSSYKLSELLTRLTYDFASLRNMKVETVFEKLKSGMTGQVRGIRELGADISQARLQEIAWGMSIKKPVSEMTQAEKTLLRLVAVMQMSSKAQGDMAKTLYQPANLMRVLGDQFAITARYIGALFIPMIQAVIPYVIFFVRAIGQAILGLGRMLGIDVKGMSDSMGAVANGVGKVSTGAKGAAGGMNKAADAAKKLKNYMLGIDELNVLQPETDAAGGAGGGVGGGAGGGVDDSLLNSLMDKYKNLADKPFADMMDKIGTALRPLAKIMRPFWDNFVGVISAAWRAIQPILPRIGKLFTTLWDNYLLPFYTFINTQWSTNWQIVWGIIEVAWQIIEPIVDLLIEGIDRLGKSFFKPLMEWLTGKSLEERSSVIGMLRSLKDTIKKLQEEAAPKIAAFFDGISNAWKTVSDKTKEAWDFIAGIFRTVWGVIVAVVKVPLALIGTSMMMAWDFIKKITKPAWDWIAEHVWKPIKSMYDAYLKPTFDKIAKMVRRVWDGLKDGLGPAWNIITDIFTRGVNALIRMVNLGPIALLNKIIETAKKLDKTGLMKGVNTVSYLPYLNAPKAIGTRAGIQMARGGLPAMGHMFVAGEAGPELVGSFGGNPNTVMPLAESGFVEAMAGAVFGAVVSAMNSSGSGGSGDVYLDGTKVGAVIRKGEKRSGVNASLVTVGA